jgi:hypothetical protein
MAVLAPQRRRWPRILLFAGLSLVAIGVVVNDLPALLLGVVAMAWLGSLAALVGAVQGNDGAGSDSGDGDGGGDSGGDGGGGGE